MRVLFKLGRKMVSDCMVKSRLSEVRVTQTQFADAAALYSSSRERLESTSTGFVTVTKDWGLTVSVQWR